MAVRRLGVTEARRRLPGLVKAIAERGGRIEITRRGLPAVALVRADTLERHAEDSDPMSATSALRVDLLTSDDNLIEVVHSLRSSVWSRHSRGASRALARTKKRCP